MHAIIVAVAIASAGGGGVSEAAAQATTSPRATETKAPAPEVYLYGNPILGPFNVELLGPTVLINGIQAYPALPVTETKPPVVEPTPAQVERYAFTQEGWALQRKMEKEGKCCREITTALADFYRARLDLVAEVSGLGDNSFWVEWKDGTESEVLIVPSKRAQSPEDDARGQWKYLQDALAKGCLIIISSSGSVTVPANDAQRLAEVRAEIARARRTSADVFGSEANRYIDERWEGKYLPADIAREFANPRKLITPHQED